MDAAKEVLSVPKGEKNGRYNIVVNVVMAP